MWYVINKRNGKKLCVFERKVIIPLFNYMIIYKRRRETQSFISFLECELNKSNKHLKQCRKRQKKYDYKSLTLNIDSLDEKIKILKLLKYVSNVTNKGKKLYEYVDDLLMKSNLDDLRNEIAIYYKQKRELKGKNTFVNDYSSRVNPEWRIIFVEFFYKKLFARKKLWDLMDEDYYDRGMFHDNFCKDNDIYVCPYCDSVQIVANGIVDIDHFWPSSIYPFLAMNAMNMITCCKACNSVYSGKGDSVYNPMIMPTYYPINKRVNFHPDIFNRTIEIKGLNQATDNYILLIRLNERYSQPRHYDFLQDFMAEKYTSIIDAEINGKTICKEDIEGYISKTMRPKKDPFYFVTKDILKSYDKYKEYLMKSR